MAISYANSADGYITKANQTTWAAARDATSGSAKSSTATNTTFAIRSDRATGRGGGYAYTVARSFLYFNTSLISSTVDSATLNIRGVGSSAADVIAVKSNSDIDTLDLVDFDAIVGWNSSGVDNESNVTKYSNEVTWSTSGYNSITLTSDALSDMEDDDTLYVCIMSYDYDLKNVAPTSSGIWSGMYYTDNTGTSLDPYIDYTLATVATTTSNAIFFGTNF